MTVMQSLKEFARRVFFHPHGVEFGEHSTVRRPWNIYGAPQHMRVGSNCFILPNLHVQLLILPQRAKTPSLVIEDGVYIGQNAFITVGDEIHIGEGSVLSDSVYITDLAHGMDPEGPPIMEQPLESKGPVRIGKRCFLGYRVAVLPGVHLGDHCIVGANSTVTKSFPAYSMIAGSPARIVKTYAKELRQWVSPSEGKSFRAPSC